MTTAPHVFNRALSLARQAKATGDGKSLLLARVLEELQDRLALINRVFEHGVFIGPDAAYFATALAASGKFGAAESRAATADDDLAFAPNSTDAVISLLDLQTVNDVPGYMAQVAHALKPDGLALFAFFAGETLRELREAWLVAEQALRGGASPRVAPMIDLREAGGLLQRAGLALPVADVDRVTLRYADPLALMREIKSVGHSNCMEGRSRGLTTPVLLFQAASACEADGDGRIPVTLDIAWATAWKPHPSQQQPLKPGSAKARLADALKVGM